MSIEEYLSGLYEEDLYELASEFDIDVEGKNITQIIVLIIMMNYSLSEIQNIVESWQAAEYPWYGQ